MSYNSTVIWKRASSTYGGAKTTDQECIWYSPACLPRVTRDLFDAPLLAVDLQPSVTEEAA